MRIAAISHKNTDNRGDLSSVPHLYFDIPVDSHIDIGRKNIPVAEAYIVGGGTCRRNIYEETNKSCVIYWGIGSSLKNQDDPGPLPKGSLVGSRDVRPGLQDVPCVSCMSMLFDRDFPIEHEAVLYLNNRPGRFSEKISRPNLDLPVAHNGLTMEECVRFLGSGELVVTNSYHGAYWATLLKRRTVIINPYSSKFLNMRFQPPVCNEENWRKAADQAMVHDDALDLCRISNRIFYRKVLDYLQLT